PPRTSKAARTPPRGSAANRPHIAIITARSNAVVTDALERGALAAANGTATVETFSAAGSFELLALTRQAAANTAFHGVLALGCIIRGQTRHDEFLGHAVTSGLARIAIETGVPIGLGVLTVENEQQALVRAGLATPRARGKIKPAHGNKGEEAMHALIASIHEARRIARSKPGGGR
ncbi:MAG: 6,7-dimethyl-8-ribityllumazine synthase, partial [Planctomyces sp.]